MNRRIEIVPSILSADLTRLGEQVREAVEGGADRIQVDVMDGHFVPNLTFGPGVVEAVRSVTDLPIEAHLMVERPDLFLQQFARAGATVIIVQVEAASSLYRTVTRIKDLNVKAAVALNPATSVETVREIAPYIDMVNVMTVEPGFGGQAFMPDMLEKVRAAREDRLRRKLDFLIEVDGGIGPETAKRARAEGADVFVAGNSVFGASDPRAALAALRAAIAG